MGRRKRPADKPPVELTIESMDDQGRGVARLDGKVVFVANALPGERVVARYTRLRGRYDEATAEQYLEPSPHRVEPRCTHANICGGCVLQHVSHDEQLRIKQARLADNLERLGSARPERWVEPVAEAPWGYRSRARLGVKHVPKKGGVLVGFRERAGHRLP
ncbi:MAG: 23S rRNA (uracil(1939)-C(5))-methyltransferase, partial [Gammaproteobacteria bacterium]|nr:23S rRNA (uracil(1939)-C(5))-methyltransferase [Gammaproteobacteria bacterium]